MTLAMCAQALLAVSRARLFAKPAASDQALATFKKSRGLAPGDLASVLPNIGRFARPNLGFMAS